MTMPTLADALALGSLAGALGQAGTSVLPNVAAVPASVVWVGTGWDRPPYAPYREARDGANASEMHAVLHRNL